jgi:FtsZ-interacting cell division protein ZipA
MLDTLQAMGLLTLMEIVGPVVLAAALIYGIMRSRRGRQTAQANAATRRIYAQEDDLRERVGET